LRHCDTSRKVAGSFSLHYDPGVDSASNRNEYIATFMCRLSRNPGSLNLLEPPAPVLDGTWIAVINTQFQDNCIVEETLQCLTSRRTVLRDNLRVAHMVYNFPVF